MLNNNEVSRIAIDLFDCANAWEPQVHLVGNVRADAIAQLCLWALDKIRETESTNEG